MRILSAALLLLFCITAQAQKSNMVISMVQPNGQAIKGDATIKGFERSITVLSNNSSGRNNVIFNFTMPVTGAAAGLKKYMSSGEFLTSATVVAMQGGEPVTRLYTIKMEKLKVLSCTEAMGCNGVITSTVSIQATRIGWTYFQTPPNGGASTVTNKYGYDAEANGPWTNF